MGLRANAYKDCNDLFAIVLEHLNMHYGPFYATRLKILRAHQHINSIEKIINDFMAREQIFVEVWQDDKDSSMINYGLKILEPLDSMIPLIIGDAVHNLRSSLDFLACEIVRESGESDRAVYFPFAESKELIMEQIKRRNFDRAIPEAIQLLLSLEPYKGGNAALRAIHDLDIKDKHLWLIADYVHLSWLNDGGAGFSMSPSLAPESVSASGSIWAAVGLARGYVIGQRIPVSIELRFPLAGPFAELPLIPTLRNIAADFSRIVDAFETLLHGAVAKPS